MAFGVGGHRDFRKLRAGTNGGQSDACSFLVGAAPLRGARLPAAHMRMHCETFVDWCRRIDILYE